MQPSHDRFFTQSKNMTYFFDICQIMIRVECPFQVNISPEMKPFLASTSQPDLVFRFLPVLKLSLPEAPIVDRGVSRYCQEPGGYSIYQCPVRSKEPYAKVSWHASEPMLLTCFYLDSGRPWITSSRAVIDLLGLETVMLHRHALLLHAAFIRSNGRGILFTAPSGTGKSTQASLWEKYMGAETLNGDRAGIRKIGDTWHAFGLPYAGSSNIYRNESAPLKALVLLRQAKENRISRISSAEAMRSIYPEITIHRWDPDFVSKALDLFLELCTDVPVYLLECLPNKAAVQTLEERLLLEEKQSAMLTDEV